LPLATFFRAFGARSVWDPCDSAFGARPGLLSVGALVIAFG
jgi:hypothetical protein